MLFYLILTRTNCPEIVAIFSHAYNVLIKIIKYPVLVSESLRKKIVGLVIRNFARKIKRYSGFPENLCKNQPKKPTVNVSKVFAPLRLYRMKFKNWTKTDSLLAASIKEVKSLP